MEVSREVHVDFIRRRQGAFTAAGSAALAAEYRAHGGLPKRQAGFFTDGLQPLRQTDGDGGFPFSGRGGRDGGHQNKFAGCGRLVQYVQGNLGLVAAEGDHVVFIDAQLADTIGECGNDHVRMMTEVWGFCKKFVDCGERNPGRFLQPVGRDGVGRATDGEDDGNQPEGLFHPAG